MYTLNFFTFKVYVYKIYKTVLIWDFINLHERLFIFTNNRLCIIGESNERIK